MQPSRPATDEYSLYVRNLEPSTPLSELEELLYELFLQAGPLSRVSLPQDRTTGQHKGYCFVEFAHKESVPYAMSLLQGIKLNGRPLVIKPAGIQGSGGGPPSAATPSTPTGRTPARGDCSPSSGSASCTPSAPPNPFQQALDYNSRPPSVDFRSPTATAEMLTPHRSPPGDSPLGYPHPPTPGIPPPMSPHHLPPFYPFPHSLFPPPLSFLPPPLLSSPSPVGSDHAHRMLHEARLHPRDHPHWLRGEVRDHLSHYHQHELERHPHRMSHDGEEHRSHDGEGHHHRSHDGEGHLHRLHDGEGHLHRSHDGEEHHHRSHDGEGHHHRSHDGEGHLHRSHEEEYRHRTSHDREGHHRRTSHDRFDNHYH